MKTFIQLAAFFNIASGLLLLAYWYLYAVLLPYRELSDTLAILVQDRHWFFVNLLGSIGALAGIVGLVGLFLYLGDAAGNQVSIGFAIALIGSILMFAALLRDTLLWPILAAHDPDLLSFTGPIYASRTFLPFFIFSGVVYTLGYVLFGLGIASGPDFPAWTGHALAWGALLFGLGALFGDWQVVIRTIGITGMSAGLIWIGRLMLVG